MISTLIEFVDACKTLDNEGIYELFDKGVSELLRDHILTSYAEPDCNEPTRSALNYVGLRYNVQSLKDY